jgi:hypothetical protein
MLKARGVFTDERIEKARRGRGEAIDVIVADEPEAVSLNFLIEPDERLFISYESGREKEAHPLVERVAEALGYEMELV